MIGAGRMGEAVLAGLVHAGWDPGHLVAAEPNAEQSAHIRAAYGIEVLAGPEAAATADVIVIAVKPHDVPATLREISGSLADSALVISLAAGVPLGVLSANLPSGAAVARVMPNTPALVGQGMSAISCGPDCTAEQRVLAHQVLSAVGAVVDVPESAQDAVTAVSGSGPAYVFYFVEAMVDAGVMLGLTRPLARQLAHQTLLGAATMLAESGDPAAVLREQVTSPGGTTARALHTLDQRAVKAAIADAMVACHDKSAALTQAALTQAALTQAALTQAARQQAQAGQQ